MRQPTTAWLLGGLLVLTGPVWAQDAPGAKKDSPQQSEDTVKKEDVHTWILNVEGQDYEAHPATPAYEGETGLFHMSTAYTLPKGKVSVSVFRDTLDRDPKDQSISIFGLSLGYGATSRLELFGNVGVQNRNDVDAVTQAGFNAQFPFAGTTTTSPEWQTGFGDVTFGGKYKFLDDYGSDGVGLALRAYVKIGTADNTLGLGTGKTSIGGDLILSKRLGFDADLHGSVGYLYNANPTTPVPLKVGNAFKWGVGLNVPACRKVQLQAEVTGLSYSSSDFPQDNPIDIKFGPVVWFSPGVFLRANISWNANFKDYGTNQGFVSYSDYEVSIGYHPGTPCKKVYNPPPPPPPPANRPPTVQCEVEKSTILPGETVKCRAIASDPDGDPLTYSWTSSAGKVTGSGTEGTFDSAGVAAPATVTVTVTVSDGRGGTASSKCTINVQAPTQKAEVVTCTSGGFPANLSRLNNVDKACLDDVASRLKQDPRSRVIIVGYADKNERYPDVIGRKRAEAVKDYLVKERGVDASRITAKSAGNTKPLDTGTTAEAHRRNRRVDVIFVPEGATPPEN
jgi:outer membrane protein OmpA-like peptidoglycan-associated protein